MSTNNTIHDSRHGTTSHTTPPPPTPPTTTTTTTTTTTNTITNNWRNPTEVQCQRYNLQAIPMEMIITKEEEQLLAMYDTVRNYERTAIKLKEEMARAKLAAKDAVFQQSLIQQNSNLDDTTNNISHGGSTMTNQKKRIKEMTLSNDTNNHTSGTKNRKSSKMEHHGSERPVYSDGEMEEAEEEDEMESDIDSGEDTNTTSLHDQREAKLAQMRKEIELAKQQQQQAFETESGQKLRQQMLGEETTTTTAITTTTDVHGNTTTTSINPSTTKKSLTLRRKNRDTTIADEIPTSSLIANMTTAVTPPHDFSNKLELSSLHGTILFPTTKEEFKWVPPSGMIGPNDGAFQVSLSNFDLHRAEQGHGNNTVAIKFQAPSDSKRFSINIAAPDHDNFQSILFHLNPRQRERGGQLIVNDKQDGIWGHAVAIPLSQLPLIFGETSCTLMIQINGEGYDIFLQNQHCARLEHRKALAAGTDALVLQFPSTDDYGSPENWSVFKVWWGNKAILAKGDVSGIPGVNTFNSVHPRKLFISDLSRIFTEGEVDLRRAELERAFRSYGGDRGVSVIAPTNATYAFVEVESERMADRALNELAETYRMNRARRSRYDALKEERAAAEAAKMGIAGDGQKGTNWD